MLELSCWNFTNHPGESTFLLGLLKPISGETVKEEYPPINRVIAKKSTLNVKIYNHRVVAPLGGDFRMICPIAVSSDISSCWRYQVMLQESSFATFRCKQAATGGPQLFAK